jgi:glycosyltransferase involved in cell wall biosynthesis
MGAGLVINGKFLGAKPTGVHRTGAALLEQLGGHVDELTALFGGPPVVLAPNNVEPRSLAGGIALDSRSHLRGQLWEQCELPLRARGRPLLSFCNLSPILAGNRAVTMFHDAQVRSTPASYTWAFRNFYQMVQPQIGRHARKILTVSHFSVGELARFGMAPQNKIRVIHNGVDHVAAPDHSIVERLGLEDGRYVLALSSVQSHKNIGILLEAFAGGQMGDLRLVLFGAAGPREFANAGLPCGPEVVFAGRVSDAELTGLMERALCFAMPSRTEGFGLPPLEAMAAGCPAVIAPEGALPEVCGQAALQAAWDDASAWAFAFQHLANDPAQRACLVQRGLAQAARFNWHSSGEALMTVLREVAGEL